MCKPYYEAGGITIYHGDCHEVVPQLAKVDLLLTDPPYGIGADERLHRESGTRWGGAVAPKGSYPATSWDAAPPDDTWLHYLVGRATSAIIFGGNYYGLGPARCMLVWDKCNGENSYADAELAWTNLDKAVRLKRHRWHGMLRQDNEQRLGHPTQKPLGVIKWAMSHAPAGIRSVMDPYLGSGTTLVAAKEAGLAGIGIEAEESFCEMAARRLQQEVFAWG